MGTGTQPPSPSRSGRRSYDRLSQPEMIALLRDYRAGRYRPRYKQERYRLEQRAKAFERAGIL